MGSTLTTNRVDADSPTHVPNILERTPPVNEIEETNRQCIFLDGSICDGRDYPSLYAGSRKRLHLEKGWYVYRVPPHGGVYRIEIAGAAGQDSHPQIKQRSCSGKGAILFLELVLRSTADLWFLVGQQATLGCNGGGGASVMSIKTGSEQELLAIAGGGGNQHASLTADGTDSLSQGGVRIKGTGGRGGRGGRGHGGQGGQGGAGWFGGSETMQGRTDDQGPKAIMNTLEPGYRYNPQFDQHHYGGLGGGGCEWYSTGGGGGYSGGGGAECYGKSGGGGTFVVEIDGLSEVEERRASNEKAGYVRMWCCSFVLTVHVVENEGSPLAITFTNVAGEELANVEVSKAEHMIFADIRSRLADDLELDELSLQFVLRDGRLFEPSFDDLTVFELIQNLKH